MDSRRISAAIDLAISRYSDWFFEKAKCALSVYGANNGTVHVAISARNVNLPAYWFVIAHWNSHSGFSFVVE